MITLVDCPHCKTTRFLTLEHSERRGTKIFVYCDNCGLSTPYGQSADAAAESWNFTAKALLLGMEDQKIKFHHNVGYVAQDCLNDKKDLICCQCGLPMDYNPAFFEPGCKVHCPTCERNLNPRD